MYLNKRFSSLSINNDRKKKDTSWHITRRAVLLATPLAFQNGRRSLTITKQPRLTCKACLVVNHPEIAFTLENV